MRWREEGEQEFTFVMEIRPPFNDANIMAFAVRLDCKSKPADARSNN